MLGTLAIIFLNRKVLNVREREREGEKEREGEWMNL